jgi:hypothetical protein
MVDYVKLDTEEFLSRTSYQASVEDLENSGSDIDSWDYWDDQEDINNFLNK